MNNGNICVSVFSATAEGLCEQIRRAELLADIIELRFDHLAPGEIDGLIQSLPLINKRYLFTFRPKPEGGPRNISREEREAFWAKIHYDLRNLDYFVDYEADLQLPANFDGDRAIVSSHAFGASAIDAISAFEDLSNTNARIIKIAQSAEQITDAIAVWSILKAAETADKKAVPIAMGEAGKWTRILALAYGAFLTYASLDSGSETAPGQISASDLNDIYRVRELSPDTGVYGLIAGDTSYSMSPYLHNPAFKEREVDAVFVPLQIADLDAFLRRMVKRETREVDLNFKGFSVTNPHKQAIVRHLAAVDPDAAAIGAINTVKIVDGDLHGYNTDAEGFIRPLIENFGDLKQSRSAVIGSGGAARTCVYMLKKYGSEVTVFGRDHSNSEKLAEGLGVSAASSVGADYRSYDIVVNATPVGTKGPTIGKSVAIAEQMAGTKVVYDLTYNPTETTLAIEAKKAGALFIGGLEMLIEQGASQFEIWTGLKPPIDEMGAAVRRQLSL